METDFNGEISGDGMGEFMKKIEQYRVKCPERIMFGDPWDFEHYKDRPKIRDQVVVNYAPQKEFVAGVVLEDKEDPDSPGKRQRLMAFYFAPEEEIETYMNEKMFSLQKTFVREIVVDSKYVLAVEGRHEVWPVDVDGVWGNFIEYYREEGDEKVIDAEILLVVPPDSATFDDMRALIEYLFKDVRLVEKEEG